MPTCPSRPARARTWTCQSLFPQAFGTRFGMLVESAPGAAAAPLVVEWAHYADAPGVHWSAGAAALGTLRALSSDAGVGLANYDAASDSQLGVS